MTTYLQIDCSELTSNMDLIIQRISTAVETPCHYGDDKGWIIDETDELVYVYELHDVEDIQALREEAERLDYIDILWHFDPTADPRWQEYELS